MRRFTDAIDSPRRHSSEIIEELRAIGVAFDKVGNEREAHQGRKGRSEEYEI
jgi:hypothetical protein